MVSIYNTMFVVGSEILKKCLNLRIWITNKRNQVIYFTSKLTHSCGFFMDNVILCNVVSASSAACTAADCSNQGECTDLSGGAILCTCSPGYTGKTCQTGK